MDEITRWRHQNWKQIYVRNFLNFHRVNICELFSEWNSLNSNVLCRRWEWFNVLDIAMSVVALNGWAGDTKERNLSEYVHGNIDRIAIGLQPFVFGKESIELKIFYHKVYINTLKIRQSWKVKIAQIQSRYGSNISYLDWCYTCII